MVAISEAKPSTRTPLEQRDRLISARTRLQESAQKNGEALRKKWIEAYEVADSDYFGQQDITKAARKVAQAINKTSIPRVNRQIEVIEQEIATLEVSGGKTNAQSFPYELSALTPPAQLSHAQLKGENGNSIHPQGIQNGNGFNESSSVGLIGDNKLSSLRDSAKGTKDPIREVEIMPPRPLTPLQEAFLSQIKKSTSDAPFIPESLRRILPSAMTYPMAKRLIDKTITELTELFPGNVHIIKEGPNKGGIIWDEEPKKVALSRQTEESTEPNEPSPPPSPLSKPEQVLVWLAEGNLSKTELIRRLEIGGSPDSKTQSLSRYLRESRISAELDGKTIISKQENGEFVYLLVEISEQAFPSSPQSNTPLGSRKLEPGVVDTLPKRNGNRHASLIPSPSLTTRELSGDGNSVIPTRTSRKEARETDPTQRVLTQNQFFSLGRAMESFVGQGIILDEYGQKISPAELSELNSLQARAKRAGIGDLTAMQVSQHAKEIAEKLRANSIQDLVAANRERRDLRVALGILEECAPANPSDALEAIANAFEPRDYTFIPSPTGSLVYIRQEPATLRTESTDASFTLPEETIFCLAAILRAPHPTFIDLRKRLGIKVANTTDLEEINNRLLSSEEKARIMSSFQRNMETAIKTLKDYLTDGTGYKRFNSSTVNRILDSFSGVGAEKADEFEDSVLKAYKFRS